MIANRTRRARAVAVLLAAGLALSTAACGSGEGAQANTASGEDVQLRFTWWGNADRAEITEKAVALFEAEHPDIDVVTSFQDYEPYWQRIATETAGGGAPDVFQMDYSYLSEYAGRGALLDLEKTGDALDVSGFVPGLEKAGVVDGKRVGVPMSGNTFSTMYVPAMYEEAGIEPPKAGDTWEDFNRKISQFQGAKTGVYGASDYTGIMYVFEIKLRQGGDVFFTEDGELGFTPEQLKAFWEEGQALQKAGTFVPIKKAVEVQPVSSLGSGLVATENSWDNFLVRYEGEQDKDVKVAPMPQGGTEFGQYIKPGMLLSASAKTDHPEAAAQLIDFLINDEAAAAVLGANRGLPATTAARAAAALTGVDAEVAAYEATIADQLEPTPVTPPAGAGSLESAFIRLHEEAAFGRISVDEAVSQFFDEAERLLK